MRNGDTVGRHGVDEFINMSAGINNAIEARPVAENPVEQFSKAISIDGRELILTQDRYLDLPRGW